MASGSEEPSGNLQVPYQSDNCNYVPVPVVVVHMPLPIQQRSRKEQHVYRTMLQRVMNVERTLDRLRQIETSIIEKHLSHPFNVGTFPNCRCYHPDLPKSLFVLLNEVMRYFASVMQVANANYEIFCNSELRARVWALNRTLVEVENHSFIGKLAKIEEINNALNKGIVASTTKPPERLPSPPRFA